MEPERDPMGEPATKHPFSLRNMLIVWLAATVCVVIAMGFTIITEREIGQYTTSSYEACARNAIEAQEYSRADHVLRLATAPDGLGADGKVECLVRAVLRQAGLGSSESGGDGVDVDVLFR